MLCLDICVHLCAWCSWRSEESLLTTGVTDVCEYKELNSDTLREGHLLLIVESSLFKYVLIFKTQAEEETTSTEKHEMRES